MMKFSWAISWVKWLSGEQTKWLSRLVVRLVPWGRGQRWSSKHRFAHCSTIWPGW